MTLFSSFDSIYFCKTGGNFVGKTKSLWLLLGSLFFVTLLFQNCGSQDSSPTPGVSANSGSDNSGNGSNTNSCEAAGTLLGSCYAAGTGSDDARCTEYYNTDLGNNLQQGCESNGDTWSTNACPGSITATCYTELSSMNYIVLNHWYAVDPVDITFARSLCNPTNGQGFVSQFCSQ